MNVLVISGPNLQLLGTRQPEIYGTTTLPEIHAMIEARAKDLGVLVECRQTNHEGVILDWIGAAKTDGFHGILLNAGAFTHTSIAIYDALTAVRLPCIEVHLSTPERREEFRRTSYVALAAIGRVAGFGARSYTMALEGLVIHLAGG